MKKNQSSFQKRFNQKAALFLAFLFLTLFIFACIKKKDKQLNVSSGFGMKKVILTKAQVQAWVDSGWMNPADSHRVKYILLQFYSANGTGNDMELVAYPCAS